KEGASPVLVVNERLLPLIAVLMDSIAEASVEELTNRDSGYSTRVRELVETFAIIKELVP
ncbi:hypothetical protein LCGC14_3050820, partial [marine sediment metagenome]